MSGRVEYAAPPTIWRFMQSDLRFRGLMGPFGSGKSSACVIELMRRAKAQRPGRDGIRRSRWAVIRNTYRELDDTTKRTFLDWIPEDGRTRYWHQQSATYRIRQDDIDAEFLFRALDRPDDVKKLLSLELTGAWVNEAREVPVSIIDALDGRIGRFPARRDGGVTWRGIIMDTNPPDTDSWWYRRFEEGDLPTWEVFKQPSGLSRYAENIENLDEGYYQNLVVGKNDEWVKIYVHGEYGFLADGKRVYPEYVDRLHCAEEDFDPAPGLDLWIGMDFGLSPAAIFAQRDSAGRWYVIHELIGEEIGADRFAQRMRSFIAEHYGGIERLHLFGDPAGDQRSPTDEATCFDILRRHGFEPQVSPSQDPQIRREAVAAPLGRLVDGKPGMILSPRCRTLRKGFQGGYQYRRLQITRDERFDEKPDKNAYSHPHDALQYLMCGAGESADLARQFRSSLSRSDRLIRESRRAQRRSRSAMAN